ncbi:hypothetical protein JCM33374_g6083 [Metschnikowia sp. JCM 33374]|nr:hypothetical protein JCM33374_g6083 [Metschnikowia sp. JCM 33374]
MPRLFPLLAAVISLSIISAQSQTPENTLQRTKLFPVDRITGYGEIVLPDQEPAGTVNYFYASRSQEEVEKAHMQVDWFIKDLKGFVNGTNFDFRTFDHHIRRLRNELSDMEFWIETKFNHQANLENHAIFARVLFQCLVDSTEKLKRYAKSEIPTSEVLFDMIDLNVRTSVMRTAEETLDRAIPEYTTQISRLSCDFVALEEYSTSHTGAPYGMRALYSGLAEEVKMALERLRTEAGIGARDLNICNLHHHEVPGILGTRG